MTFFRSTYKYPFQETQSFSTHSHGAVVKDFFTLMKPGVLSLVIFTGFTGMFLAPTQNHPFLILIYLVALAMASGGAAVFNMYYDRDIDSIMRRTRERPIPRGVIAPEDALTFGVLLSTGSVLLMGLAGAWQAACLLAFSIFFYGFIYTILLKRHTSHNIEIGGAAGAFPPVIGWMTQSMEFSYLPLWMFLIIFIWTPSHFWALALLRADDYKSTGVPMLPVTHGIKTTKNYIFIYSVLLALLSFLPLMDQTFTWFYGVSCAVLSGLYVYKAYVLKTKDNPLYAGRLFGYSIIYLFALFFVLLLEKARVLYG